jgi:hypothetical protein
MESGLAQGQRHGKEMMELVASHEMNVLLGPYASRWNSDEKCKYCTYCTYYLYIPRNLLSTFTLRFILLWLS